MARARLSFAFSRSAAAAAVIAIAGIVALTAQQTRTAYQDAYRDWRTGDPNLERDAGNASPGVAARADKAGIAATKYAAARKAYFDGVKTELDQKSASLEAVPAPAEPPTAAAINALVAASTRTVDASLQTFANDPDRALQQLRLTLDREKTALGAVSAAAKDRQTSVEAVDKAAAATEQARAKVVARYVALSTALDQAGQGALQQGAAWSEYYQKLAEGSRGVTVSSARPPAEDRGGPPAGSSIAAPSAAAPSPSPASPSPASRAPAVAIAAPAAPARSVTPLSLSRYTGDWVYSTTSALFHGAEPAAVDMAVREENGQASGTVTARFKGPGSPADTSIRFEFSGAFQPTRNQTFALMTSDGVKGTVELIPGPAFNLIEVNFTTAPRPRKIAQANFLLIKK